MPCHLLKIMETEKNEKNASYIIRAVTLADAARISEIYNYYIINTAVSFESQPVDSEQMAQRISDILTSGYPYIVCEHRGRVVGYCYLHSWSGRCAYRTSAEISVYVDKDLQSKGAGSALMQYILEGAKQTDIHTIIAGICIPNAKSTSLHEKFGFRQISHFKEIGFKLNQWRDVGHWQLLL